MRGTDPIKSRWECLRIMMFVAMCSRIFDRLLQLIFVYLGAAFQIFLFIKIKEEASKKIIFVCS